MAKQRPSYLKRQKEQARKAKAQQKRETRNARRSGAVAQDDTASDVENAAESTEFGEVESMEPEESNQNEA